MTKTLLNLALAAAVGLTALTTGAQAHRVSDFEDRFAYISAKLERERQRGRITFLEGRKLRRLMNAARDLRVELAADGHLSHRDRHALDRELDHVNRAVNTERSDRRRRWRVLPRVGR
ncbi:MAG: hypothetical protein AAFZ05_03665 [Pseudomonadota bacterium]